MRLIFIHIPKAGGTTLHTLLSREYSDDALLQEHTDDHLTFLQEISSIDRETERRLRCIEGHIPYGVHRSLGEDWGYATFLRHPVNRVLSHYFYVRRSPHHYLYDWVTENDVGIADYVAEGPPGELHDGQVRMLSGVRDVMDNSDPRPVGRAVYETAMENTEGFVEVGLVEEFDASLLLLAAKAGWGYPFYVRKNTSRKRPGRADVDKGTLEVIRDFNRWDIRLYDHWKERLETRIADRGLSFQMKVEAFRKLNGIWGLGSGVRKRVAGGV